MGTIRDWVDPEGAKARKEALAAAARAATSPAEIPAPRAEAPPAEATAGAPPPNEPQAARAETPIEKATTAVAKPEEIPDVPGDRILENIRTGGSDPLFRKSWLGSFWGHLLLIVILPWLWQYIGCRERYNVPHGSGEEAVAAVLQVTKPVKKKKRYVLNLQSAIILSKPDLDKDSDIEETVEKASEVTYTADTSTAQARAAGKMGKGGQGRRLARRRGQRPDPVHPHQALRPRLG